MSESDTARRTVAGGLRAVMAVVGAVGLTLAFFMILPFMQAITAGRRGDLTLQTINTAALPPPPPPIEEELEEEEEEEEEPPELEEEAPPLDLSQLELALNPGFSGDWLSGDFAVKLDTAAVGGDGDAIFTTSDLDTKPRCIYQPGPIYDAQV